MNELMNLVLGGVMLILSLLMPVLAPAVGIWVGLWVAKLFLGAVPLVGKPVAAFAHWLRVGYVKLLGKLWGIVAKFGDKFLKAVWRGIVKVAKIFFPAVTRGAVRLTRSGHDRLRGPTPPPAAPPPP